MKITLDDDEREVINCLIEGTEKTIISQRLIKYAFSHGLDLRQGETFDYNKETGEVTSPSELLKLSGFPKTTGFIQA